MADIVIPQPGDAVLGATAAGGTASVVAPVSSGNGAGEVTRDKKEFTQAELDALFSERARRAADKATADLLSQVGVKSADELKTLVTQAEESRRAQMSELDKARADAQAAADRATKAEQDKARVVEMANSRVVRSAIEEAARQAGFRSDALPDVVKLIDRSKITVEGDADGEVKGVAEAVKAFAKGREYLLGESRGGGTPARANRRAGAAPAAEAPHRSTVKL